MNFFGRNMFFGIGGLMVSPLTIGMAASTGASGAALAFPIAYAAICVVWVLLGMTARTRGSRAPEGR